MNIIHRVAFVVTFIALPGLALAWCQPGTVPANPAPVKAESASAGSSGSNCIEKVLDGFSLNQETVRTVNLKKDQSYWFAANGCPRMGTIQISVADTQGKEVKKAQSNSPSFCFKAKEDGKYKIKIKALSLTGSNTSGNIDSCFSDSKCN